MVYIREVMWNAKGFDVNPNNKITLNYLSDAVIT